MTPIEECIRRHLLQYGPMTVPAIVVYARRQWSRQSHEVRDAMQRLALRGLVGRCLHDRDQWVAVQP